MKTNKIKFTGLIILSLIFILSTTACDNGGTFDTTPDTYNAEIVIEGVANEDHAEFFSVLKDGESGVDQFNYEDSKLTGNITDLSGTTELTLVIDNDNLTDGEYTAGNRAIQIDSNNNEAKFEVKFVVEKETYNVSVNYDNGTVEGDGDYAKGEEVELISTPDEGYEFVEWTGYIESTENPLTFEMPEEDVKLTVNFNEENSDFAGGIGTELNPYQVANADQLNKIRNYPDKYFTQINDIDLIDYSSGAGWSPIDNFSGGFNGNDFKIINLGIGRSSSDDIALFNNMSGEIVNLYLKEVNITGESNVGGIVANNRGKIIDSVVEGKVEGTGFSVAGGIAGNNSGEISNCKSEAEVYGNRVVGGLVGRNFGDIISSNTSNLVDTSWRGGGIAGNNSGKIYDSYSNANVVGSGRLGGLVGINTGRIEKTIATGKITGSGYYNGGLVGVNEKDILNSYSLGYVEGNLIAGGLVGLNEKGQINNSYSKSDISAEEDVGGLVGENNEGSIEKSYAEGQTNGVKNIGGLVGKNYVGIIYHSYATGKVSGDETVGGLVGWNRDEIKFSYATGYVSGQKEIGGLIGNNEGFIKSSYYDKDTTDQSDEGKGIPKSTKEMIQQATFTPEWDFNDIWKIDEDYSYPYFQWQDNNIPTPPQ